MIGGAETLEYAYKKCKHEYKTKDKRTLELWREALERDIQMNFKLEILYDEGIIMALEEHLNVSN